MSPCGLWSGEDSAEELGFFSRCEEGGDIVGGIWEVGNLDREEGRRESWGWGWGHRVESGGRWRRKWSGGLKAMGKSKCGSTWSKSVEYGIVR